MSAQLVYNRTNLANVSLRPLQASAGFGHGRVVAAFDIHHTSHNGQDVKHPRVVTFAGTINDAQSGRHITDLSPKTFAWRPDQSDDYIYLEASVTTRTIEILNDARKTPRDDVNLIVKLRTQLDGPHGWQENSDAELRCRVSASDWLTMLEQFGHTTMTVIEVPVAGVAIPEGLANAGDFYRRAVERLGRCDWDGAIADARQVFDEFRTVLGASEPDVPWADFAQRTDREAWGFDQRLSSIRMIVRNATHTAHHGGKDRGPDEARYIVAIAGLALKLYAARLK